jgi:hypothetical protein
MMPLDLMIQGHLSFYGCFSVSFGFPFGAGFTLAWKLSTGNGCGR